MVGHHSAAAVPGLRRRRDRIVPQQRSRCLRLHRWLGALYCGDALVFRRHARCRASASLGGAGDGTGRHRPRRLAELAAWPAAPDAALHRGRASGAPRCPAALRGARHLATRPFHGAAQRPGTIPIIDAPPSGGGALRCCPRIGGARSSLAQCLPPRRLARASAALPRAYHPRALAQSRGTGAATTTSPATAGLPLRHLVPERAAPGWAPPHRTDGMAARRRHTTALSAGAGAAPPLPSTTSRRHRYHGG